jgi:hypothetical protein
MNPYLLSIFKKKESIGNGGKKSTPATSFILYPPFFLYNQSPSYAIAYNDSSGLFDFFIRFNHASPQVQGQDTTVSIKEFEELESPQVQNLTWNTSLRPPLHHLGFQSDVGLEHLSVMIFKGREAFS